MRIIPDFVKEYKKRIAEQIAFVDQNRKSTNIMKEKYWFSNTGRIFPVEHEHGDQALTVARALELIDANKSIGHYGYKSNWQLAKGFLLDKNWLRVQVFDSKEIGLNAKPSALERKSTENAVFTVLLKPHSFNFQENWPYTLEYSATINDYKRYGWKGMIKKARREAILAKKKEMTEIFKYSRSK